MGSGPIIIHPLITRKIHHLQNNYGKWAHSGIDPPPVINETVPNFFATLSITPCGAVSQGLPSHEICMFKMSLSMTTPFSNSEFSRCFHDVFP